MLPVKINGILFRKIRFQESSLIVNAITENGTLRSLLFKGALRRNSKLSNELLPFAVLKFTYYPKGNKNIYIASQVELVEDFEFIRESRYYVQVEIAKLIKNATRLLTSDSENPEVYSVIVEMLRKWRELENVNLHLLKAGFMLKILTFSGFRPTISTCANCGASIAESKQIFFSPSAGGFVCDACPTPPDSFSSNFKDSLVMGKLLSQSFDRYIEIVVRNPKRIHEFVERFWMYYVSEKFDV